MNPTRSNDSHQDSGSFTPLSSSGSLFENMDPLDTSIIEELAEEPTESAVNTEKLQELKEERERMNAQSPSKMHRPRTPGPDSYEFLMAASAPKYVSMEEILLVANGVGDLSLTHEIAINPEFKLEKEDREQSSERQAHDKMYEAFWTALRKRLNEKPPDYGHALLLLADLKHDLFDLLMPSHRDLMNHINEVLDLELIEQKAEHEAVDIQYYADYVVDILSKLCAPARDDQVAALREIKDVVDLFKEIFNLVDLMKMDLSNFIIQEIRPIVQKQSTE